MKLMISLFLSPTRVSSIHYKFLFLSAYFAAQAWTGSGGHQVESELVRVQKKKLAAHLVIYPHSNSF
jgi:hypothetical protein